MTEHDALAQLIILLGQALIANADTLAGKALAAVPALTLLIGWLLERRWLLALLRPLGGPLLKLISGLFAPKQLPPGGPNAGR